MILAFKEDLEDLVGILQPRSAEAQGFSLRHAELRHNSLSGGDWCLLGPELLLEIIRDSFVNSIPDSRRPLALMLAFFCKDLCVGRLRAPRRNL